MLDMDPLTTEPTIKLEMDTEPGTLAGMPKHKEMH